MGKTKKRRRRWRGRRRFIDRDGEPLRVLAVDGTADGELPAGYVVQDVRCKFYRTELPLDHEAAWVRSDWCAARFRSPEQAAVLATQTAAGRFDPKKMKGLIVGKRVPSYQSKSTRPPPAPDPLGLAGLRGVF